MMPYFKNSVVVKYGYSYKASGARPG